MYFLMAMMQVTEKNVIDQRILSQSSIWVAKAYFWRVLLAGMSFKETVHSNWERTQEIK